MRMQAKGPLNINQPDTRRRHTLLGVIGLWVAPWASAWSEIVGKNPSAASSGAMRFIEFSKLATGRPNLDPAVGATLFAALVAQDRAFGTKLAALDEFAQSRKITDIETLDTALQGNPMRGHLLNIIAAWYIGAVGEGPRAKEVTYLGALMYEPSADGSHNPGFCAGATNSWGSLPRPPIDVLPKI